MKSGLLTATEVSTRLGIDRSTVYRMAMDGRLHGVKVGDQWRFPPRALEGMLMAHVVGDTTGGPDKVGRTSLRAARTAVLEAVAPVLDVTMAVTDMDGHLLTDIVNPCAWFIEHGNDPAVLEACSVQWREMAGDHVFTPTLQVGTHGFACARSFVRDGDKLIGMVIAGGIGPDADDPVDAVSCGLHHLDLEQRAQLLGHLPRVAAALSSLTSPPRATEIGSTP